MTEQDAVAWDEWSQKYWKHVSQQSIASRELIEAAFLAGRASVNNADLVAAQEQLRYLWNRDHACPCGARDGAHQSRSHVIGCSTAAAIAAANTPAPPP